MNYVKDSLLKLPIIISGTLLLNHDTKLSNSNYYIISRNDFIKHKENNTLYEYRKKQSYVYQMFKEYLYSNDLDKSKNIFDNSIVYGLQYKPNICHCNEWDVYKDIKSIALHNDLDKFIWFYENIIKNYENHIKKESNQENKLEFYDEAWHSNNEIKFNIIKRFSNMLFRDLISSFAYSKNKTQNKSDRIGLDILKYLIDSGNIDIDQISYAQNTICNIGDIEIFKFLDSAVEINYNVEYGDFFRSACSHNNYEIAKLLLEKNVHKLNKFGFDNTFYIACRDTKDINIIKLLCSIYDGKHIEQLKILFNSEYYNKETKEYLESIGYTF